MANNASYALGPLSVPQNCTIVTPGTTVFNPPLTKLFIQTGGTLVAEMAQTGTLSIQVPNNFVLDGAFINIGTVTTAIGITGFW